MLFKAFNNRIREENGEAAKSEHSPGEKDFPLILTCTLKVQVKYKN